MSDDAYDKDSWETPQDLFDQLNREHNFIIDACCTENNNKCKFRLLDALDEWTIPMGVLHNQAVFMNPPYSKPEPFLKKAWEFSDKMKVVCLVPASIISCKYLDFLFEDDFLS